jgi:hypothetical protein
MTLLKVLGIPAGIAIVGAIYWFVSYEPAGTVLLLLFAIAMGVMSWSLVPTFGDIGPTAPVEEDWHERRG